MPRKKRHTAVWRAAIMNGRDAPAPTVRPAPGARPGSRPPRPHWDRFGDQSPESGARPTRSADEHCPRADSTAHHPPEVRDDARLHGPDDGSRSASRSGAPVFWAAPDRADTLPTGQRMNLPPCPAPHPLSDHPQHHRPRATRLLTTRGQRRWPTGHAAQNAASATPDGCPVPAGNQKTSGWRVSRHCVGQIMTKPG